MSGTTCPQIGCVTSTAVDNVVNIYSYSCIGASGGITTPGSITTGYALATAIFASTDSKCTDPISGTIYAVGVCISNSASSSLMITADSSNNLYSSNYATSACSGTPTAVYAVATVVCSATSTKGYTKENYYLGASLLAPTTAYSLTYTYPGASCSAPFRFDFQIGGTCTPSACKPYANVNGPATSFSNQTVCFGAATPPTFRPTLAGGATAAPTAAAVVVIKATQVCTFYHLTPSWHRWIAASQYLICLLEALSCSTCLLLSWGAPGSTGYAVQFNAMATAFQASLYKSLNLGTLGGNVTVTSFTQTSTSRRGLLAPTLTAAYTGTVATTSSLKWLF